MEIKIAETRKQNVEEQSNSTPRIQQQKITTTKNIIQAHIFQQWVSLGLWKFVWAPIRQK